MAIANSDGSIVLSLKISTQKAIGKLKGDIAKIAEGKNAFRVLSDQAKQYQNKIKDLEKQYAILLSRQDEFGDNPNFARRLEYLQERIKYNKQSLNETTSAIGMLGKKAKKSFSDMSASAKNFGKRIAGIIKSALIFSVLYRVMQGVVKLFNNILMSNEQFREDWEELKAALYTAAYPIINLIVPAIKWIVQQVRDWAVSIGKVAAALQGMSYSELVDQAKASKEAADNYADMEKSSKKTADNVKKQFASFDDIEVLSSGNEEEQGAGLAGFEGLKEYDTSGEKSMLKNLMNAIGGALAAVGLILLFKGQIGWGIGFLIVGASFWAISEIWGEDDDLSNASTVVENIMETIGVSLAAVGLILLTKGIWQWGIGFIVAGAAIWAIKEFATTEFSTDPIKNTLIKIMGIAGTALAALGIILLVFGQIPWGIAMLAAGAVMLVTAVALNSDAIVEAIRGPIGVITAIAGAALLVLGIILTCTGNLMLGIPLIALGAAALVTPIALNWNAIVDLVKNVWNAVTSFWNTYIAPVFTAKFWLDLGKGALNGLIWAFELALNVITGGLRTLVNGAIELINTIGGVIGLDWDIPTIPKISLPRLAQGTVVPPNKEFMAILGDNTKEHEIVSPVSTMKQAFMEAMVEIGGSFGGGNTEVVLEIDGREFGRAVVEQGNKENRRIGTRLVIV